MQQTLELSIRASIDQILGKEKVKNELAELTQIETGTQQSGIRNDPVYQEIAQALSAQQLRNAQKSVEEPFSLLGRDITKKGDQLMENIMLDYEYGTPRRDTRVSHAKNIWKFLTGSARQFDDLSQQVESDISNSGTDEEKILRRAELEQSKQESKSLLEDLIRIFEKYFNPNSPASPHNPNNPANPNGLVPQMIAIMSMLGVSNIASRYSEQYLTNYRGKLVEAQIGAGWQTAFSYDAMGSYVSGEQMRFSEYAQRRRYTTDQEIARLNTGTAVTAGLGALGTGLIAGTMFSPGVGTVVGGLVGLGIGLLGSNLGEQKRIDTETELTKKQGEMQGNMKMITDLVAAMAPHVQNYRNWDIMSMQQRARQGSIATPNQIGYLTREQEIQEELQFGDATGYYDPREFRRAYTFARSQGLQGSQIYQTQRYRFMLGEGGNGNIAELDFVRRVTESMYGNGIDPKKQLEVLESIRNIQLDMLKLNIKADVERGKGYADIPRLLMGDATPYGRINELGGTTLDMLRSMTTPKTLAHEAFMFQMMGAPDLFEFEEFKKGGMFNNPELAAKFLTNTQELFANGGLDRQQRRFLMNNFMDKVPQGMVPYMEEFFSTGKATVERQRYRKLQNGEYIADDSGGFVHGQLQQDGTVKYQDADGKDIYEQYNEKHKTATVTFAAFIEALKKGNSATEMFGVKLNESAEKQVEVGNKYEAMANKFVAASTMILKSLDEQSKGIGAASSGIHASLQSLSNSFTQMAIGLPGLMEKMKNAMDLSIGYYLKNMVDKGEIDVRTEYQWLVLLEKFISDPDRRTDVFKTIKPDILKPKPDNTNTKKGKTKTNKEVQEDILSESRTQPKARGGFVHPNKPYLIGEEGAEIFIPDTAGTIVSNNQLHQMGKQTLVENNSILMELQNIKLLMAEIVSRRKEPDPINVTVINKMPEDHFAERNRTV